MLFLMFVVIGIYSFIMNVVQKSKGDAWVRYDKRSSKAESSTGTASYITKMSLGNFGMDDKEYEKWPMWILLGLSGASMLVILVFNIFYRRYQH